MDVTPHLDGLRAGLLRVTRCGACGLAVFPFPRTCPGCGARGTATWFTASGRGAVWSAVVFHKTYLPAHPAPYPVVVVALEDGPRLLAALAGPPPEAPADAVVGRAVTAEIRSHEEPPRVVFHVDPEGES